MSPQGERRGGVLGGKVERYRNLGDQGAAIAAQGNQAVLSNLAEGLEGRTLAAVNGLRVGASEGEDLLALRVVVQGSRVKSDMGFLLSGEHASMRAA